jgi:transposase-like protein
MRFRPRHCPQAACPSNSREPLRFHRKGFFRRKCDGRCVQRFLCLCCRRTFSIQSFRMDYRLKKPTLHFLLFKDFVSKVTHRQSARTLGCTRRTVAHRLQLLGTHCRAFHQRFLRRKQGRLQGLYQLDELETFEHNRRLAPVTVPVLIERRSYFVLHLEVAPLPARGGLRAEDRLKKQQREARLGRRRSGSRAAVGRCFEQLARGVDPTWAISIATDRKSSYPTLLSAIFPERLEHQRCHSRCKRNYDNPLFPINHTLAMMRDGISRLVRRTWAASKCRARLESHAWIWIVYRNYMRGITNRSPAVTPAMALGVSARKWRREELLAWRVPSAA